MENYLSGNNKLDKTFTNLIFCLNYLLKELGVEFELDERKKIRDGEKSINSNTYKIKHMGGTIDIIYNDTRKTGFGHRTRQWALL